MRRALGLALLAAALVPLAARAQAITAAPGGEMTSLVGMPFDVPFYLDMTARTEKLGAFAARIRWNPAVLRLDGGSNGTFGSISVNEDSVAVGVARLAGANPAGVGGLITLGVLHFTPLVAQPDTVRLAVTELFAAGSFADLTSSLTTRNGYFCPARGMFGDIDKDGSINSRDALIALSNAVGLDVSAFDITVGDVDANGATNARDALIILSSAVGLPVTSFRVGRLAGGACAANLPLVMAVVPNTVDVAVGQTVAFEARAADSSGTLQTVTDAIWRSGNSAALAVFGDGTALARDTGTVRVTAVRTALDSAQAVVHIVARRTRHIVDAAAASARNQLGTAAFPFSRIGQGLSFAQDGDTVEVRPGRYDETVNLSNAAVLMGDTLPDGTRPLVAGTSDNIGIQLQGTGVREVHDLALDGFGTGVDVYGPSRVLLRGLLATHTHYGLIVETPLASLRIEKSRLTGNGTSQGGNGVEIDAPVQTLVVQESEISDFGYDGVLADGVDSLAVLRSQIHDVGEYGFEASPNTGCGVECAPPAWPSRANDMAPPSTAVVVDSSSIVRAGYRIAYLDGVRSAVFSHSRLGGGEYGVEVYGSYSGWVRFLGDSVANYGGTQYYSWLDAYDLDSLAVDSVFVQATSGNAYHVPLIRVSNTSFMDVRDNPLYASSTQRVFLDNVKLTGDPHCDLCGDGFDFGAAAVTANRLSVENTWNGIQNYGDSSITITHSLFRHVQYPVYWSVGSYDTLSRLTVDHTTFSGFGSGIEAYNGAVVVDSSTFENSGGTAIYWDNGAPSRITRNRITSVSTALQAYAYRINAFFADSIADNVITDAGTGILTQADDSVAFSILRNAVTCNRSGASNGYGIALSYASGMIGGNQVLGCWSGIDVYDDGSSLRSDSIVGNTVTLPSVTAYEGIYAEGTLRTRVVGNTVTDDTTGTLGYGAIAVYGYQPGATATIDSNVVTGGSTSGIYVTYLDTALVRFNAVRGVKAPNTYQGGVVADGGLANLALIHGNQVRRTYGNGIRIFNSGFIPDTAMIQVDSNLVDSSTADGIRLDGGVDSITRNRITRNAIGIEFASYSVDQYRSLVSGNNIVGNLFGLWQGLDAYYQAPNNWWGDVNGPRCVLETCNQSLVGDSVMDFGVNYTPFATAEIAGTPAPAVRALPILAMRTQAVPDTRRAPATGLDAPLMPKPRPERVTRAPSVQAPPALAAARVPAGLDAARAQAWQRVQELRTAAVAARVQRDAAQASAQQARLAADAARAQLEQRKAEREASRAAIQVKRAARTARHGRPQ